MEKLSIHADKVQFHSAGRPVPPVGAKNLSPYVRCRPMLLTGGTGKGRLRRGRQAAGSPAERTFLMLQGQAWFKCLLMQLIVCIEALRAAFSGQKYGFPRIFLLQMGSF